MQWKPPILCVFAEASQEAFGACAYIRAKKDDDTLGVKFVAAKSRVAPIKQLTIPCLELQAAVLANRLAKSIQEESRLQFTDVKFFTDSTITLAWIRNSSRSFKPFVSSREGEIQSTTDPNQWNHIPSEDTVADDLSRGMRINELQGRWMNEPQFLRLPEDQWPTQQTPPPPEEDMERRQIHLLTAVTAQKAKSVIDPSTFSSWRKLIRVTARIRRLEEKIRLRKFGQHQREGLLTPEELAEAERFWIKEAQKPLHSRMKKGEFKNLSPFTDEQGVVIELEGDLAKQSYLTILGTLHFFRVIIGSQR